MFTSIFGAPVPATEEHAEEDGAAGTSQAGDEAGRPAAGVSFDIWGVAAAVSKSVRQRADELVKSVQETDWKSELSSFSKGVSEDTKTLTNKTAELVEHLPEVVEHLPEKAAAIAVQLQSGGAANRKASDSGGASSAGRDAPASASGAQAQAQFDLDTVGVSLSQFGRSLFVGTKELIEQVRDGIEEEIAAATKENKRSGRSAKSASAAAAAQKLSAVQVKYSRFDAEVAAMQRDSSTYLDEPEDAADFERWSSSFSMSAMQGAIDALLTSNSFMSELHSRIVPAVVENDEFWTRYFYRLHKLQQKEEQRAALAQRVQDLSAQQEEELGWDDLDPDGPEEEGAQPTEGGEAAGGEAEAAGHEAAAGSRAGGDEQGAAEAAEEEGSDSAAAVEREEAVEAAVAAAAVVEVPVPLPEVELEEEEGEQLQEPSAGTPASKQQRHGEEKHALLAPGEELAASVAAAVSPPAAKQVAVHGEAAHAGSPGSDAAAGGAASHGGSNSSAVEVSEGDVAAATETASESSVSKADWYVVGEEAAGLGAGGDRSQSPEAHSPGAGAEAAVAGSSTPEVGRGTAEVVEEDGVEAGATVGEASGQQEAAEGGAGAEGPAKKGGKPEGQGKAKEQGRKAAGAAAASGDEDDLDWGNWD